MDCDKEPAVRTSPTTMRRVSASFFFSLTISSVLCSRYIFTSCRRLGLHNYSLYRCEWCGVDVRFLALEATLPACFNRTSTVDMIFSLSSSKSTCRGHYTRPIYPQGNIPVRIVGKMQRCGKAINIDGWINKVQKLQFTHTGSQCANSSDVCKSTMGLRELLATNVSMSRAACSSCMMAADRQECSDTPDGMCERIIFVSSG